MRMYLVQFQTRDEGVLRKWETAKHLADHTKREWVAAYGKEFAGDIDIIPCNIEPTRKGIRNFLNVWATADS